MKRAISLLGKLRLAKSGIAMTEMALAMPFFLTAGLWAIELSNYTVTNMRVSQLATHLADNASRIGEQSSLEDRKIYESDINDLLLGASLQAGNRMALFDNGRAIISSLEVDPDDDTKQYIHWQRCMGTKIWNSSYGDEGDRLSDGMGPAGEEVFAFQGEAVMFVEVAYDYQPLVSEMFVGKPTINVIASFTVRANRDLSQIYQRDKTSPDPVASCAVYENSVSGSESGSA